jgi:hypothetical protein
MIRGIIVVNSIVGIVLAMVLLLYPPARAAWNLRDPALKVPGVAKFEWRLMRHLTPRYAAWAEKRVAQGQGVSVEKENVEGTEWPLFGSVFYLWGIENLQKAWDKGDHTGGLEPKAFCQNAIVAASDLVVDPKQAGWVQRYWGTNYLHRENVFYRMLVIAALTSREELLHDGVHLDLLRDQVETLAKELDASRTGLLDDYPGQCYPSDIIAAIACIRRADSVLGTDHSKFVSRSLRAFTGRNSSKLGLPPSFSKATTGASLVEARGCANSFLSLTSPELWPGAAKKWFQLYEKNFWQKDLGFVGFREYIKNTPGAEWSMNVDAGPVMDGFGVSANAFGVGAARKNGRFDLAYPLAAETLATVWEMPNGTLAMPRVLSNMSDAPFLGEAAVLFFLSVQPEKDFPAVSGGSIPPFVYIILLIPFFLGLWRIESACDALKTSIRGPAFVVPAASFQSLLWICVLAGAVVAASKNYILLTVALLFTAQLLPRGKRASPEEEDKNWITPAPHKTNSSSDEPPGG